MVFDLFKAKSTDDQRVSLMKTLSWRVIGTIDTIIISYLFTGKLTVALGIGGFEIISKMILYYIHERTWVRIVKGKWS